MFSFIFGDDDKKKAPKPEGDAAPAKGNKGGAPGNKQNKRSSGDDRDSRGSNKGSGNSTPTATFQIGDHVRTQNLEKLPHFDGKLAVILTLLDAEGKHKVQIRPKGQNLKLYPTRLRAVSEREYLQENPEGDKPIQNLIDQARQSFGVAAAPTGANANNVARDNNSSTSGAANKDNKQGNAANNARGSAGTVQNAAPPAGEAQDNTTKQGSVQSPEPAPKTSSTGATTSAAANANAASGTRSSDSVQQVQQQQMAAARKADTQYSIAEVYENATPAQADQQTRFSSTPAISVSTGTKQPQKSVAVVEPQKSSTPQLSQSGTTSGNANLPAAGTTSTSVPVSGRASSAAASLTPEEVEKFGRRRSAFFTARHGDAIAEQERTRAEFVQELVEESDLRVDAFLKSYALEQKMMQKKAGAVGAVVGDAPQRDTINGRGAVPAPSSLKGKGKKA
ncbi:unnamed protein product [Amoebophrya sp. A120]|nr:unnamed protein product [Amoebophrya sp. A120]|eukprot:GSA120T00003138001.1